MVKKIILFFAYVSFFILALIYFTPKVNFYYFLEKELKPFDVVISNETLVDNRFSLNIDNAVVNLKSIQSAKIESTNIKILGLFNSINVKNIELSSAVKSFVPQKIDSLSIDFNILNPLHITGLAVGGFGNATLDVNLIDRKVDINLVASDLMKKNYKSTLRNLKKSENGEYVYVKTF